MRTVGSKAGAGGPRIPMPRCTLGTMVAVALLCSAATAGAWRQEVAGEFPDESAAAFDVAVDSSDHVVATGFVFRTASSGDFTVARFDGGSGTMLWKVELDGALASDGANAVVTDAVSNVYAAGSIGYGPPNFGRFTVVKLDPTSGAELWRATAGGMAGAGGVANALAVDALGNPVAVGSQGFLSADLYVTKLDALTGAELWHYALDGSAGDVDGAAAIAVDPDDNVVVLGELVATGGETIFTVVKIDGGTGAEMWRYSAAETRGQRRVKCVVADGAGDVFATGTFESTQNSDNIVLIKLAGVDGTEIWRRVVDNPFLSLDVSSGVSLDSGGNPVVVGALDDRPSGEQKLAVVKFDSSTGDELWRRQLTSSSRPTQRSVGLAIAHDAADDVLAVGFEHVAQQFGDSFITVKLDGASGSEIWRQSINELTTYSDGPGGQGLAVRATSSGDVVAVGTLGASVFTVLGISGLDGAIGPVVGKGLRVRDRIGDPTRRSLAAVLQDTSIKVSPAGSAGDPVLGGATLTLSNPLTTETATLTLPGGASNWTALGSPPGSKGYRYRDAAGINGACTSVLVKPGKVRATCRGTHGPIPFDLDEATQGMLTFSLRLGSQVAQCATFGGSIRNDSGTANPGPSGRFTARNALVSSVACPLP